MKKIFILILPIFIYASNYMANIEPINEYEIYANASGEVTFIDKEHERALVNGVILKIDDKLEQNELKIYNEQLSLYEEKLKVLNDYYEKYKNIRGKSAYEQDEKYIEIIELKNSIESLKLSIVQTKDTISKKTISLKNLYLKEFDVNKYDYVSAGTKIATAYDISEAKLIIYLTKEDFDNIKNKKILIDGKENIATLKNVDITLDTTFVSAYKAELKIDSKDFGKSVNVEIK